MQKTPMQYETEKLKSDINIFFSVFDLISDICVEEWNMQRCKISDFLLFHGLNNI